MASKGKGGPNTEVYKKLFKELDKDDNGYLTFDEFQQLLSQAGSNLPESQRRQFFEFFDAPDGDSRISFPEFCNGLDQIVQFVAQAKALFKKYDKSGDGFLDRKELKRLLSELGEGNFTDEEVDSILKEADRNRDNKIGLDEFINAFC